MGLATGFSRHFLGGGFMFLRRGVARCSICFILAVLIVVLCFSGPYVASVKALALYDDIVIAVLIAFGSAIGVTLSVNGFDVTSTASAVKNLVQDFLTYIGVSSISVWLNNTNIGFVSGLFNLPSLVVDAFNSFWAWVADGAPKADTSTTPTPAPTIAPVDRPTVMPDFTIASREDATFPSSDITSGYILVTSIASWRSILDKFLILQGVSIVYGDYFSQIQSFVSSQISAGYSAFFVSTDVGDSSFRSFQISCAKISSGDYVELSNRYCPSRTISIQPVQNVSNQYIVVGISGSSLTIRMCVGTPTYNGRFYVSPLNASVITSGVSSSSQFIEYAEITSSVDIGYIDVVGIPDSATLNEATDEVMDAVVSGTLVATIEISDTVPVTPTPVQPTPTVSPVLPPDLPLIPDSVLTEKFPFSIPSDLLSLVSALSAEPEAPIISWDLNNMGVDYVIEIDMSRWNTVASICRTCEYVLFLVGLAVATRRIYLRG